MKPFRILCLVLFPGALNSVQLAKVSRVMDFKKVFRSNVVAVAVSGIVGIVLAYLGAGVWALVAQNLLNVTVAAIVIWFTVKWRPMLVCNIRRIAELFSYGWKLLVSGLIDTIYNDIYSLVIGRRYDAGSLAYYNRGKQFPQFIINAINTTIQTVMLPAMSMEQNDRTKVKVLMQNSICVSSFLIFPMMAGLAGIATPMVQLLLTDKWLPCVPYLRISCFSLAFLPVHSCNLQAINAMGRSDIFLKLEIIKKQSACVLVTMVACFDSPLVVAMTGVVTTITSSFINAFPSKKLIGYSYLEQMRDILPSFLASLIMLGAVLFVGSLNIPNLVKMLLQIVTGIVVYFVIAATTKMKPFQFVVGMIRNKRK